MHDELIMESRDIENCRNFFQLDDETTYSGEERIRGKRHIAYLSPQLRTLRLKPFYYCISEKDKNPDVLKGKKFQSQGGIAKTL